MTNEDKKLLLTDLCARLPHGVMCNIGLDYPLPLQRIFIHKVDGVLLDCYKDGKDYQVYLSEVKPYLRPMYSVTEQEEKDLEYRTDSDYVDYCNEHYLDYRGLIEKKLALEAPEGMYSKQ